LNAVQTGINFAFSIHLAASRIYSLENSLNTSAAIRIFWVHVVKEQFFLAAWAD